MNYTLPVNAELHHFYYLPADMQQALITGGFILLFIIIFLWGMAIGRNATSEEYKIADKKDEVRELRREVADLKRTVHILKGKEYYVLTKKDME